MNESTYLPDDFYPTLHLPNALHKEGAHYMCLN